MTDERGTTGQSGTEIGASSQGGGPADRGGVAGPAGAERSADTTETDATGTGSTGVEPTHRSGGGPGQAGSDTGSAPVPTT